MKKQKPDGLEFVNNWHINQKRKLYIDNVEKLPLDTPGLWGIKNLDLTVRNVSNSTAKFLGYSNPKALYGKSDYDLPGAEYAEQFHKNDKLALNKQNNLFVEKVVGPNDNELLSVAAKYPLYNRKNELEALFVFGYAIVDPLLFCFNLDSHESLINAMSGKKPLAEKYIFRLVNRIIELTIRESQCYYYLMRHLTNSEIADKLGLSTRTVEMHIENIKQKVNCTRRTQLIEIAQQCKLYLLPIILGNDDNIVI